MVPSGILESLRPSAGPAPCITVVVVAEVVVGPLLAAVLPVLVVLVALVAVTAVPVARMLSQASRALRPRATETAVAVVVAPVVRLQDQQPPARVEQVRRA